MQPTRSEINRTNAQHSTGPRTDAGKSRSSQNSFQHGLYSKQLIIPGEDPAEFDALRAQLRAEHRPANTVEEILVEELAQNFWRLRRFRKIEATAWNSAEGFNIANQPALATLLYRSMASAERAFHKALAVLTKLRKDAKLPLTYSQTETGSVPSNSPEEDVAAAKNASSSGFVPQNQHDIDVPCTSDKLDFTDSPNLECEAA